jgi:DNA modification methylase
VSEGMYHLIHGDCLEAMRALRDGCVDAVVTDPPSGIAFMGQKWDTFGQRSNGSAQTDREEAHRGPGKGAQPFGYSGTSLKGSAKVRRAFIDFLIPRLAECLRVCRPGAVALVWALPRTSHWTALAIEEAGWVIEEKVYHHFGTGFPKHKSKLKPSTEEWILCRKPGPLWLGVEETRIGTEELTYVPVAGSGACAGRERLVNLVDRGDDKTPDGRDLARVLERIERRRSEAQPKTVSGRWPANLVLSHSPGCRLVGTRRVKGNSKGSTRGSDAGNGIYGNGKGLTRPETGQPVGYASADGTEEVGHWECVDGCPAKALDEQAGERKCDGLQSGRAYDDQPGGWPGGRRVVSGYTDAGGPSRFYATFPPDTERFLYCSKASKKDRGEGNSHPTVKSTTLMAWLVKLACPEGGLVLDPFGGTFSTGVAAVRAGRYFIGVESDPDYFATGKARMEATR